MGIEVLPYPGRSADHDSCLAFDTGEPIRYRSGGWPDAAVLHDRAAHGMLRCLLCWSDRLVRVPGVGGRYLRGVSCVGDLAWLMTVGLWVVAEGCDAEMEGLGRFVAIRRTPPWSLHGLRFSDHSSLSLAQCTRCNEHTWQPWWDVYTGGGYKLCSKPLCVLWLVWSFMSCYHSQSNCHGHEDEGALDSLALPFRL